MNDTAQSFRGRWWIANSLAFATGMTVFSLLGHGITGPHGDELSAAQYVAHTVGLIAASLLVLAAQRQALGSLRKVSGVRPP